MAGTFRLAPMVQARAQQYAGELGISINALVAIALTDYLGRKMPLEKKPLEDANSGPQARSHGSGGSSGRPQSPEAPGGRPEGSRQQRRRLKREAAKRGR